MSAKLGRIEKVDLRSIWTSEDRHFTPWLAQDENLEILGEALGIELELEAQEKDVGPFRADILCKNTADESWVLIENQIEKTDHAHLGQLLTYAAGLKAVTIVWIASSFRDEHRAALDWLNETTDDSIRLFGLEVELWRIGESPAAPRFNIVCQPNDWQNNVRNAAVVITSENDRPSQILRVNYWTALRSFLRDRKCHLRPQKPSKDHWYNFGIGTSQAHIAALLISRENKIGVSLYLHAADAKETFADIYKNKENFERIVGAELDWREMPDNKVSRVVLLKQVNNFEQSSWPEQFEWLQNTLEKFNAAFRSYFQNKKAV